MISVLITMGRIWFLNRGGRRSLQQYEILDHLSGIYLCLPWTFETTASLKNCHQEQPTWEYVIFQISGVGRVGMVSRIICKVDIFRCRCSLIIKKNTNKFWLEPNIFKRSTNIGIFWCLCEKLYKSTASVNYQEGECTAPTGASLYNI